MSSVEMVGRWLRNYQDAMQKSRLASQIAAFLLLMIAVLESWQVIQRIQIAENPNWQAVSDGSVPIVSYMICFGIRFFILSRKAPGVYAVVATWWLCALTIWVCGELYGPWSSSRGSGFIIYDLFSSFPLEVSGITFLCLSIARFAVTAFIAFPTSNVIHSDR